MKTSHKLIGEKIGQIQTRIDVLDLALANQKNKELILREVKIRQNLAGLIMMDAHKAVKSVLSSQVITAEGQLWPPTGPDGPLEFTPDGFTYLFRP
jgi:hypothetical protein